MHCLPIHSVINTEARPSYPNPHYKSALQVCVLFLPASRGNSLRSCLLPSFIAPRIIHSTLAATLNAYTQIMQGQRATSLEQPVNLDKGTVCAAITVMSLGPHVFGPSAVTALRLRLVPLRLLPSLSCSLLLALSFLLFSRFDMAR